MKKATILLVALALVLALMAAPAMATYFEVSGTSSSGSDILAAANVITGAGSVEVQLWNLQVPMENISQVLSDFSFVLSDTPTADASLASPSVGTERAFNNGAFTDTLNQPFTWGLTTTGATIKLDDLNSGDSPIHTIIGPPNADGTYSSGNSGLVGNAATPVPQHSPYLFGTESDPVTWLLNVPGVTADTLVTSATFSFGTATGDNHTVPLPPSVLLLGSGFLGIGILRFRKSC